MTRVRDAMTRTVLTASLVAAGVLAGPAGAKPASERIEKLIAQMTLAEKVGQMTLFTSDWSVTGPSTRADYLTGIASGKVGAIFNAYTTAYTRKLQDEALKSRLKIPLIFGYDVIHGHRTIFPIPLGETASFDLTAVERAARIAAVEATAEGLHWTFAPMLDVARDARWGRIAESSGEDTYVGCRMGEARVRGFQGTDLAKKDALLACAKHFAAYGAPQAGRDYHTVDMSLQRLWADYLPPYKAALDAGAGTVMTAFHDLNGIPCTANRYLLEDVLRKTWGFEGFVVTDYTSINEMVPHRYAKDERDAGRLAALAGVDQDMQGAVYQNHLAALVESGAVPVKTVDDAVRRILVIKERLGLFDDPYSRCDPAREKTDIRTPEHLAHARTVAGESIVLLKNDGNVLPLDAKAGTVALIGPLVDAPTEYLGNWTGAGDGKLCTSLLAAVQKRVGDAARVTYAKGCAITGEDRAGFDEALKVAGAASVIVAVMGESGGQSGEAASRADIGLPGVQRELLIKLAELKKPIVLVLMNGRPLALAWEAQALPALLETWFAGSMAAEAITDVLFGDVCPSGKLPVSFPRVTGQVPLYYSSRHTGRPYNPAKPDEKYVSRYLDVANSPQFPFGHGLSYTTFTYGKPASSAPTLATSGEIAVSVDITNTGKRDGDEVAQLYVTRPPGSMAPPDLELKGFQRVKLKAGEKRTVTFPLKAVDLLVRQPDLTEALEPGTVVISTGTSSSQLTTTSVEVVR